MTTYTGHCHCGAFKYQFESPELASGMACNCSYCAVKGFVLTFVSPDKFKLTAGDESKLSQYRFNKKQIAHSFCPTCGVQCIARGAKPDGSPIMMINLRTVDGVDVDKLKLTHYDGKNM